MLRCRGKNRSGGGLFVVLVCRVGKCPVLCCVGVLCGVEVYVIVFVVVSMADYLCRGISDVKTVFLVDTSLL